MSSVKKKVKNKKYIRLFSLLRSVLPRQFFSSFWVAAEFGKM